MFELLAEPNRRAILSLLALSQQSVGEIERELRMPQSSVSKHLQVLRDAGFVESTVDYTPGPADRAHIKKDGENLTLILVKDLRHSPERSGKQILTRHICMNGHPVRPTKVWLWHNLDRRYIAMGAAGWHICPDVLDHFLSGLSARTR